MMHFSKLVTWMLMRYSEISTLPEDTPLDGLIIPRGLRGLENEDNDKYLEAVGMERLYSTVAHVNQNPTNMVHLFHTIGKAHTENRLCRSNGSYRTVPNLPPATRE